MSAARMLAVAAAGAGVLGAWDVLASLERARLAGWARWLLAPLERAGRQGRLPSTGEQRRLAVLAAAALLAAGWLAAGAVLALVLALAGPALSLAIVRARRRRYVAAVQAGAAAAARSIGAALAAGRSVRAAVAEAAGEVDGPAGQELRRAAHAFSVGEPTDAVLERVRRSAGGSAWDTLVAALMLQRDAGGDLAGLLRGLAASLEASARAEREARAATAQSRTTAWIVAGLPLAAATVAELGSPGFLMGLLGHPVSLVLTAMAVLLQVCALICIRRLTR